jgi:hypothetical protein
VGSWRDAVKVGASNGAFAMIPTPTLQTWRNSASS